jgi:hypothetical protein
LVNIGRNGEYKKGPKTKAEVTPQISVVCWTTWMFKLNNNKEAQNGVVVLVRVQQNLEKLKGR